MKQYGTGCQKSKIDGTEKIFETSISLPKIFSLTPIMAPILNQGNEPKCVAYSLTACMDYMKNIRENDNNGSQFSINELYNMRNNKPQNGMTIKNGLSIILHNGLKTNDGNGIMRIKAYAKVNSINHLKSALMLNGPCPVALPVKSYDAEFWRGKETIGCHCVVVTGFNDKGFEIRNSWGKSWGKNGYTHISYSDFEKNIIEIWTLIK